MFIKKTWIFVCSDYPIFVTFIRKFEMIVREKWKNQECGANPSDSAPSSSNSIRPAGAIYLPHAADPPDTVYKYKTS